MSQKSLLVACHADKNLPRPYQIPPPQILYTVLYGVASFYQGIIGIGLELGILGTHSTTGGVTRRCNKTQLCQCLLQYMGMCIFRCIAAIY